MIPHDGYWKRSRSTVPPAADSGDEENAAANELADAADAHLVDESSRYVALAELVDEYQSEPDTET